MNGISNNSTRSHLDDDIVAVLNLQMAERFCQVGDTRAPGVIEYIFLNKLTSQPRAKVIMDSGAVRYVDACNLTVK